MSKNADISASARPLTSPDARSTPPEPRLVNLPNGLTLLRLALVPVFVLFLVANGTGSRIVAFFVFGIASVTDLLDGQLARRSGMITDFGKIADPIADKALTGSALITLSVLGDLPWWVTVVILAREVGVTVLRFWVIRHGVIAASRGGKIKTVLQIIAIGLYILPVDIGWVRPAVMAAAVAVTLVTGADYMVRALRLRRAARNVVADGPANAGSAGGSQRAPSSDQVPPAADHDSPPGPPVSPPGPPVSPPGPPVSPPGPLVFPAGPPVTSSGEAGTSE